MTLNTYYNRFNPDKEYEKSLFLAGRGLQSAELNETQEYALSKLKGIGDAIFRDGDVIIGSNCIIDRETGKVTLEAGKIYLRGAVRKVEKEEFIIPLSTTVRIGVYYVESTITELEDENLRDPAVGTRNYQEVGAARLKVSTIWGYQVESVTVIALFTIIRTDRNMLLACYSHKHISYRIRTIIRKAITLQMANFTQFTILKMEY